MNFYELTVPQFLRTLGQIHRWLDKAQTFAEQKKFDPNLFLTLRLAPDQFAFKRQIQNVCEGAKRTVAALTGVTTPVLEDTETTLAELRACVDKTIAWLKTIKPEQFQGAEARPVTLPFAPGKAIKGIDFLITMALPNFYFHATTAYSILRHNGVDVGKMDFLGELPFYDA